MKRFIRVLMVAGFSSAYLMQGACTMLDAENIAGFSILPTMSLTSLLSGLGT
jgi:hypothetical protein